MDPTVSIEVSARQRLEHAWRAGAPESLEKFLPAADNPRFLAILEELVQTEMELAWQESGSNPTAKNHAAGRPLVEHYLARFPQLNDPTVLARLLDQEQQVRARQGDHAAPEEYRERFPGLGVNAAHIGTWADAIATRVSAAGPQSGGPAASSAEPPGYEVLGELGRGGMGVVYKARQRGLNRIVALKMILGGGVADEAERRRFQAEAEAVARLQHPNFVQIHEVGEHAGLPYFSLEYVAGGSLAQKLSASPLAAQEAALLVERLASAVAVAHGQGIVHRDLKPANILLTADGLPKVTDFGLAKRYQEESGQTRTGQILGTPSYMAPEQASGRIHEIGPAADVYALGAILYECLTGRPPFRGASVLETLEQVRNREPVPPSRLQPRVPRDLETICLKCLEKEPRRRYPGCEPLAADLRRFREGEPIQGRPVGRVERAWRWSRRHKTQAALAVVGSIAALLMVGGVVGFYYSADLKEARDDAQAAEQEAHRQKELAESRWVEAEEQRALVGRLNYLAHMNLAQRAASAGQYARMLDLLEPYEQARSSEEDPRQFEWYYLRRLSPVDLTLRGGPGDIDAVAVSPGGGRLAWTWNRNRGEAGFAAGGVQVRDAHTGREIVAFAAAAWVGGVAFDRDGKRLAVATGPAIKLHDSATGRELLTLAGPGKNLDCVAISRDGKRLAASWSSLAFGDNNKVTCSGGVRVWDLTNGREPLTIDVKDETVQGVVFSPDGKRLVSTTATHAWDKRTLIATATVRVWDSLTGDELLSFKAHKPGVEGKIAGVDYGPDGRHLATACRDGQVMLWDAATGKPLKTMEHAPGATCVVFAPDGKQLASGGKDLAIRLWEVDTGREVMSLKGHGQAPSNQLYRPTAKINALAYCPDGKRLVSAAVDRTVRTWNVVPPPESVALVGHVPGLSRVFTADGQSIAMLGKDMRVRAWDLATGRAMRTVPLAGINADEATRMIWEFSPDGLQLAGAERWPGKFLKVWDTVTGKEAIAIERPHRGVSRLAFSRDGSRLALTSNGIDIWDMKTGKKTTALAGHDLTVHSLAFSPDGERLASASEDAIVKLWDTGSGKLLRNLSGHTWGVFDVAFRADGKRIASGSGDGTVRIWDAVSGVLIYSLPAHADGIRYVAFSPNGQRVISRGDESRFKLWDMATGQEVMSLPAGGDVVFSPDGHLLRSLVGKGTVRIWDGRPWGR